MSRFKEMVRKIAPASSKAVHRRFDLIEEKINELQKEISPVITQNSTSLNLQSESDMLYLMCKANEVMDIHKNTFSEYKNKFVGKKVVLVGSGPTLNFYKPISDAIHIGVNGSYKKQGLHLDYLFIQDFDGEGKNRVFDVDEIKELDCKKFVGRYIKCIANKNMHATEKVISYIGAKSYFVYDYYPGRIKYDIPINMEYYPVTDNGSTVFTALHFALYGHPAEIYVVGCDCSYGNGMHFFSGEGLPMTIDLVKKNWEIMKNHISIFYDDIKVISVNPIGLKGLFEDFYTEQFLESNMSN